MTDCTCMPFFAGHVRQHPDCPLGQREAAHPAAHLTRLDRSDPAAGLRERIEALPDFRDRDDMPWPWASRKAVLRLLAATPTASPTDPLS